MNDVIICNREIIICNAFSLQMLPLTDAVLLDIVPVDEVFVDRLFKNPKYHITSAVGHEDTANVLGVEFNRIDINLTEDVTLLVAQVVGGRLPEGATRLPEGVKISWVLVNKL